MRNKNPKLPDIIYHDTFTELTSDDPDRLLSRTRGSVIAGKYKLVEIVEIQTAKPIIKTIRKT